MAMAMRNIVLFPFMAHGHLNPFMALATQIHRREGFTITIVNTPHNIDKLRHSLPPDIRFAEIPFCATDYGLPPHTENTDTLSYQLIAKFLEATQSFESPFKRLLMDMTKRDGCAPLCIISDMFLGWTVKVAKELAIFHSVFIAGAAYSMALYFSINLNTLHCNTHDHHFLLPDFPEAPTVERTQLGDDIKFSDGTDSWSLFKKRQFSFCFSSDAILLNTIHGLGEIGLSYFTRKMGGNHVWMIGPLCKQSDPAPGSGSYSPWLNLHPPASVLYVSFGSQNTILPGGFQDRVTRKKQGLLLRGWAPQQDILAHKSIGAFLSHCGWNSVLESLSEGVPIIGWPVAGEQFFNSQMLEREAGVSVEMARGVNCGVIGHHHIARVIKTVMGKTEKGKEMRRNAEKLKEKMSDAIREGEGFKGASVKAMDEFLSTALKMSNKPSFSISF